MFRLEEGGGGCVQMDLGPPFPSSCIPFEEKLQKNVEDVINFDCFYFIFFTDNNIYVL